MRKTQIKKMNLLIAFILFSQVVFSQTNTVQETNRTPTFKGWEDLIWGSTEADVKQKYESQLTILETVGTYDNGEYYCPFVIQNYEIDRYENFTVSFLFDEKTKKLTVVNLIMENPKNILNILQDLKKSVSEKYGEPQIIEETPKYKINWRFPELDIELRHVYLTTFDNVLMNSIVLSYKEKPQTKQVISNTTKQLEKRTEKQQLEVPVYQLFPTENHWTFIKLDTRNGKMWQVHFSVSEDGYQGEKDLNSRPLILSDEEINGRFTLVPTKNIYNLLLLDQLTGRTYQVQWNNDFLNRFVQPLW